MSPTLKAMAMAKGENPLNNQEKKGISILV